MGWVLGREGRRIHAPYRINRLPAARARSSQRRYSPARRPSIACRPRRIDPCAGCWRRPCAGGPGARSWPDDLDLEAVREALGGAQAREGADAEAGWRSWWRPSGAGSSVAPGRPVGRAGLPGDGRGSSGGVAVSCRLRVDLERPTRSAHPWTQTTSAGRASPGGVRGRVEQVEQDLFPVIRVRDAVDARPVNQGLALRRTMLSPIGCAGSGRSFNVR